MNDLLFEKLIENANAWSKCKESLIFANITFEVNGKVTTGDYEFLGKQLTDKIKNDIRKVINKSFEKIENGKCFSLYKHLVNEHIRYARIVKTKKCDVNDLCRFSTQSIDDNINFINKSISRISEKRALEIKQDGNSLMTVLKEYDSYYKVISKNGKNADIKKIFFYLVRPSIDNNKLNGMLYFASTETIPFEALKELARLLTDELTNILLDKMQNETIKSVISAIISRNMSHNLGSHYLYYTKNYLEDLADASGKKGPDIRGAAKVLGYMQARMDFHATIISNDRYPHGVVYFKPQIYDELTIDDFSKRHYSEYNERGKRTTNFLLSNLVMSENFTRSNILANNSIVDKEKSGEHLKLIRLQVMLCNGNECKLFTGSSRKKTLLKEKDIKNDISRINIALPGGTMSCHAFFNLLENFIRNSAKYFPSDFKEEGLVFTIAIRENGADSKMLDFIIFDNKNNAKKVLPIVNEQLQNMKILNDVGGVEKSSKGLKEMLFSSVWMKAYKYPFKSFAEIISEIHNAVNGPEKLKTIEEFGYKFVSISDLGEILDEHDQTGNLGLYFSLPKFHIATKFDHNELDTEREIITKSVNMFSEIVCFDKEFNKNAKKNKKILSYFTRPFFERDFNENDYIGFCKKSKVLSQDDKMARLVYRYKKILDKRFYAETGGDIDNLCLMIGDRQDMKRIPDDHNLIAYFERHLNTKKGFNDFMDYAYVDSISGSNFTITLNSLMDDGITADTCCFKSWYDKYYGLKIKESALTRITLIDERLFNSMKGDGKEKELELSLKNIRVLNINPENKSSENPLSDLFEGNAFKDSSDYTHFLSIHLGLIEKIVKSEWGKKYGKKSSIEKRVKAFMKELIMKFGGEQKELFISIHSGRGNFSKELEGPLSIYPFIGLAAIENAFSNSKYLLSQLFYNTVYIGKGIINKYYN